MDVRIEWIDQALADRVAVAVADFVCIVVVAAVADFVRNVVGVVAAAVVGVVVQDVEPVAERCCSVQFAASVLAEQHS